MDNVIKTTEFETSTGARVVVTAKLILKKTVNTDGDICTIDCCEMDTVKAEIEGHPDQFGYYAFPRPKEVNGLTTVAGIGQLAFTADNDVKVRAIIAELESHPKWIEKQAQIDKNQKEIAEMEAARKRNGYCPKCGSYCYGDCEAN